MAISLCVVLSMATWAYEAGGGGGGATALPNSGKTVGKIQAKQEEEKIVCKIAGKSTPLPSLKGIYTPAGSLTFSNSGLPDHHSPTL